jgi:hypothetical protein
MKVTGVRSLRMTVGFRWEQVRFGDTPSQEVNAISQRDIKKKIEGRRSSPFPPRLRVKRSFRRL